MLTLGGWGPPRLTGYSVFNFNGEMSCVTRIFEGDLESGVAGRCLACGVEWRGGAWPVEWSGGAAPGLRLDCG